MQTRTFALLESEVPTMRRSGMAAALLACDAAFVVVLAGIWTLCMPTPAYAYVDPSVMTYTIQALAGVAVALSAVAGVAWRRIRRYLMSTLKIDEQREREGDVHRLQAGESAQPQMVTCTPALATGRRQAPDGPVWHKRLLLALVPSLACALSLLFFSPLEMVLGAESQLSFGVSDVWLVMLPCACVCGAVLALALSVLRRSAYRFVLSVVCACTLAMFVQALLMNYGLPEATGSTVIWNDFRSKMLVSLAVWTALVALLAWCARRWARLFYALATVACLALVAVQAASLGVGAYAAAQSRSGTRVLRMTEDGLFSVSRKKNTIVFVLDTFDTQDVLRLQDEGYAPLEPFKGFTFYRDSAGKMIPTRYAVPYLLTGEEPRHGETFDDWYGGVYQRSSFLSDIQDAGYSIGVYSDGSVGDLSQLADKTKNIHETDHVSVDPWGCMRILAKCGIYRSAPWVAKPFFWFYQDELNNKVVRQSRDDAASSLYYMNDSAFHQKLMNYGLTADDEGEAGAFRFIHLMGPHAPYTLDESGFEAGATDIDAQARGSLKIVEDYIQQLKDLGVYDSSTIIVTADHGRWDYATSDGSYDMGSLGNGGLVNDGRDVGRVSSPIWLVKPAQSEALDREDCVVSNVPTGHGDYAATVIASVGKDVQRYGMATWSVPDMPRERTYYTTIHDPNLKIDYELQEYVISGDALDFDNWRKTGVVWTKGY